MRLSADSITAANAALGVRTFRCAKEFELAGPDNKKASLYREAWLLIKDWGHEAKNES